MYEISKQLLRNGFSIFSLETIIKRNKFSRQFCTLNYFCIFLTAEPLKFKVENETYEVGAGTAIFIGPQKVVDLLSDPTGKEFYVITFSSSFYEKNSKDSLLLNSEIFFNKGSHIFTAPYFGNENYNKIFIVDRLYKFSSLNQKVFSAAVHNSIEALLLDAKLYVKRNEEFNCNKENSSLFYYNNFKILLQRDYQKEKSVAYYADQMNITSRKLSDITEQISGKSAKEIIIDKIKFECIKAIQYTNLSFSEITYDLGFTDEGNFTNFVKKHIGKRPSEIRNVINA